MMFSLKHVGLKAQIICFLILTFALSWTQEYFMIQGAGVQSSASAFLLMWTPGIVGLLLSLVFGWKLKDIGFRLGNWKYYLASYFVPACAAILILCALLIFNLGQFELNPTVLDKKGSLANFFFAVLVSAPTLGVAVACISAFGEEIGWRGFLHTKLMHAKVPHAFLVTGVIWAVWHWPLILFSNYATSDIPSLSVLLFSLNVISLSVFMGWLREKSGSVFTATLLHGAHNMWIQGIYPAFIKPGPLDPYFGGESGVFNAFLYFILAVFIYKKYFRTERLLIQAQGQ